MEYNATYEKEDNQERQMLSPGRDVFRRLDEPRLKSEKVGEKPGQGNNAKVKDEEECDKDLIIFLQHLILLCPTQKNPNPNIEIPPYRHRSVASDQKLTLTVRRTINST